VSGGAGANAASHRRPPPPAAADSPPPHRDLNTSAVPQRLLDGGTIPFIRM